MKSKKKLIKKNPIVGDRVELDGITYTIKDAHYSEGIQGKFYYVSFSATAKVGVND